MVTNIYIFSISFKAYVNFNSKGGNKVKKGFYNLKSMGGIALSLIVVVIIISFGGRIVNDIQDPLNSTEDSAAWNITTDSLESISTFSDWVPLIALVLAASIIIGVVVTSFKP